MPLNGVDMAKQVTRKPSLGRVKDEKRQALESGLRIVDGDNVYEVRHGDLTPQITRDLRAATGMGWQGLMSELMKSPDLDLLQAFIWVARRVKGERVELDDVEIDYSKLIDIADNDGIKGFTGEEEGLDGPEA